MDDNVTRICPVCKGAGEVQIIGVVPSPEGAHAEPQWAALFPFPCLNCGGSGREPETSGAGQERQSHGFQAGAAPGHNAPREAG